MGNSRGELLHPVYFTRHADSHGAWQGLRNMSTLMPPPTSTRSNHWLILWPPLGSLSIGQPLRIEEFNAFLVAGLGSEYDALADRVGARPITDPMSIRDVYSQLLSAEQRVEARCAELVAGQQHANYVGRGGGPGGSRPAQYTSAPPQRPGQGKPPQPDRPSGSGNDRRNMERQIAAFSIMTTNSGYTTSYLVDANWYAGTGATDHFTNDLNKLTIKEQYTGKDNVQTFNRSGPGYKGGSA